jgi:hypothetical protein
MLTAAHEQKTRPADVGLLETAARGTRGTLGTLPLAKGVGFGSRRPDAANANKKRMTPSSIPKSEQQIVKLAAALHFGCMHVPRLSACGWCGP